MRTKTRAHLPRHACHGGAARSGSHLGSLPHQASLDRVVEELAVGRHAHHVLLDRDGHGRVFRDACMMEME